MSEEGGEADILLIEDNPGDVRLTREALQEADSGSELHVVTDGVEALDFLFRRNEYTDAPRPDLVILDLNVPRKNGEVILEELHADAETRPIPVVVLTSSRSKDDIERSYDLCASGYLTKPVDPDEFIEMIRSLEEYWLSLVNLPDQD